MASSIFNLPNRSLPCPPELYCGSVSEDFKALANFIPHIVWTALPGGQIEYFNERGLQYFGVTSDRIAGSGFEKLMHPEDVYTALRGWHDSMDRASPYEAECRLRRYDGLYRWHAIRALPALDESGAIARWFGTCTDVHDARFAGAMLAESEERFRVTFNQAGLGIAHVSLEGKWLRVNDRACAILGYPRDELLGGMSFQAITHPDDLAEGQQLLQMLLAGRVGNTSREKRFVRKDGSVIWTTTTVALVNERRGSPGFFIAVLQDISARKAAEQELSRQRRELEHRFQQRTDELGAALRQVQTEMADRQRAEAASEAARTQMIQSARMSAIGEMAAGIAHEIHGPLTVIRACASGLRECTEQNDAVPSAKVRHTTSEIVSTVERVGRITAALRTFARENDRGQMVHARVRSIVEGTLEFCRRRFSQEGIRLRIEVPADLEAYCRPAQISQVLLNLLSNSFDAVKETGSAWVRIEGVRQEGQTVLSVTDSGPGINPELVDKIMLPFFTTKELGQGAGLGLSISRAIVDDHGGELLLDRSCPNTRFVISLPDSQ